MSVCCILSYIKKVCFFPLPYLSVVVEILVDVFYLSFNFLIVVGMVCVVAVVVGAVYCVHVC